jgi:hypothetical protein
VFTFRYVTLFIVCWLLTRHFACIVLQLIQHYGTSIIVCSSGFLSCWKQHQIVFQSQF